MKYSFLCSSIIILLLWHITKQKLSSHQNKCYHILSTELCLLQIINQFYLCYNKLQIMRFDIGLQIKSFRCLKGLFNTFNKVIFNSKEKADIFLIYYLESKQLRILVNSNNCLAIVAVDPRIKTFDKSSVKQDSQILVIEIKESETFVKALCEVVDKENIQDVSICLKIDKGQEMKEPFRSLNIHGGTVKYRSEIFKPVYDADKILNHQWLNGCGGSDGKKIEFDIDNEHLLNILRIAVRYKEMQAKQKYIRLQFLFTADKYLVTMQNYKHRAEGLISSRSFREQKYEGDYSYLIPTVFANKVYEMFMSKSSNSKLFINNQNRVIFSYSQEGVFEGQILIKDWILFEHSTAGYRGQTKLEN